MPGNFDPLSPRVLIVDESAESRDVLRTVLERRGCRILEADEPQRGLDLAKQHRPEVVVLDVELAEPAGSNSDFCQQYEANATSLVMLGNVRRAVPPGSQFVAKPYHYGPLIRTIEQLLETSNSRQA